MSRVVMVIMTDQIFEAVFEMNQKLIMIVKEGLPKGTKIKRVGHDDFRSCWYIVYEHESFNDVPEGGKIPVVHVDFDLIREDMNAI